MWPMQIPRKSMRLNLEDHQSWGSEYHEYKLLSAKEPNQNAVGHCFAKKNTTYVMFGGVPSLLHIHNVDVKDRPQLHLHKANTICTRILEMLWMEPIAHENYRDDHKTRGALLREEAKKVSAHSGIGRIHGLMVSGCVGASELFEKCGKAVKLGVQPVFSALWKGWTAAAKYGQDASAGRSCCSCTGPREELWASLFLPMQH